MLKPKRSPKISSAISVGRKPRKWTVQAQRAFLEEIGKRLNVTTFEDWYKVKWRQVVSLGGSGLLQHYNSSLSRAIRTLYPEHNWDISKFYHSRCFWEDLHHQRQFFDNAAKALNITNLDDWYGVKRTDLAKFGASWIRKYYGDSLARALQKVYPEHNWKMWRFDRVPNGFWDDEANVREYLHWLGDQLSVTTFSDWNQVVTTQQVPKLSAMTKKHGQLSDMLKKVYPHDLGLPSLSSELNTMNVTKSQFFLFQVVKHLFPDTDVLLNYQHPSLVFTATNRPMQLDIFLPSYSLALEFQGQQHYLDHYLFGDNTSISNRDTNKKVECQKHGITLIEVPFWWNKAKGSLATTINQVRPDVISAPANAKPIPSTMPKTFNSMKEASANLSTDPSNYFVGEGRQSGSGVHPRCKACKNQLNTKNALRIIAKGAFFSMYKTQPVPVKYHICLNLDCLQKAVTSFQGMKSKSGILFPAFAGVLSISKDLEQAVPVQVKDSFSEANINFVTTVT